MFCYKCFPVNSEGAANSYLVALSNISCRQQILINSLFIFILLQILSNFPCYGFLDTPILSRWTFDFQIHGVFKVSLILISHLNTSLQSPSVFFQSFSFIEAFFQWLSLSSPLVNVTLHLKISGLFSNIFWYWFLTKFHIDKRTDSVWFQYL